MPPFQLKSSSFEASRRLWPVNGFIDALTPRLNRLPLPSLPFLDHMTQAWEGGKMLSNHPCLLSRSAVKDSALAGSRFLRKDIVDWGPVWMLQMKGIKHRIANVQQLLITGGKGHHHMTRWVMRILGNVVSTTLDLELESG